MTASRTDPGRALASLLLCLLLLFVMAPALTSAEVPPGGEEPPGTAATYLRAMEGKTTLHTLDNGWTFILVERPVAPVFSFATIVDVGSAQEVLGITGLAHMFEHMAFKGTKNLGTTDFASEKVALDRVEEAYLAYQAERLSPRRNEAELEKLEEALRARQAEAAQYVVPNAFGDAITRAGGADLNAGTGADGTYYYYSLPANKTELFAYLESERFLHPVFREFYKERDVVQEERRLGVESQPFGRLLEQLTDLAYLAHPYSSRGIGHMSDLQSLTRTDAEAFFRTYYVPGNMVTALVGDIDTEALIPLLERYFGRIPAGPLPSPLRTVEPPQIGEKKVILEEAAQPIYLEAYHKPAATHPDEVVYAVIDDILSVGRTSRLYRALVRDQRVAVRTSSFTSFPGDKYPNLWIAFALPAPGADIDEMAAALHDELETLRTEPVTATELEKAKTRAKATLVRSLGSNIGLANNLAEYHRLHGDWRELFHFLDRLEAVTPEDVMRVARDTFRKENRTVAMITTRPPAPETAAPEPAAPEPTSGETHEEAGR